MVILYGGAFNPPTIAHKALVKYLKTKYPDALILVMPTNDRYKDTKVVDYIYRKEMVELMVKDIKGVEVSDFELKQNDKYLGTADTLAKLNHPFFVMGADALAKIVTWINPETLIKDNHFIVFPRDGINRESVIANNNLLSKYADHFIIVNDFSELNYSSTMFRETKDENILPKEVARYIKEHNLYA